MYDILFCNITIIHGESFEILENGFLGISDSYIDYIGDTKPSCTYSVTKSGIGLVAMAGLVNCHTHLPMSSLRGIGENLPLSEWLETRIFPYENKMAGEIFYYNSTLSIAEALSYGTTSVTDMYFGMNHIAKAVQDSGIRANLSRSLVSFGDDSYTIANERVAEAEDAYSRYNLSSEGRIIINPSVHAEYTNSDNFISQFYDKNKERNSAHIHISETDSEVAACKSRHENLTPVAYFHEKKLLKGAICAHCVAITAHDAELLAEDKASVVHCPTSNLKLGSGVSPLAMLMEKGVNIALGTDSQASQNSLDMFFEMKLAAILHKGVNKKPSIVTVKEVLRMATLGGAIAQGRGDTGLLKVGYKADLAILSITSPNMTPTHNLLNNIVYSASPRNIVYTVVDGKILYDNGNFPTIDIELIRSKVIEFNKKIVESL